MIRALAYTGQRTAALRQSERYRATLAAELGIEPGPAAQALFLQLHAGALQPPPPLTVRGAPRGATPFVGRTHELQVIAAHLNDPDCRLLTITGTGGSGKTRLAQAAAQAGCTGFAAGAAFVSLAAIDHANQAAETLGAALQLRAEPGRPLAERLWEHLRTSELLLVLDNCEHVADLGPFIAHLLHEAPGVTILATSRAPLDLRAEWVLPIAGLALPAAEPNADPQSYPAGQLLVQTARRVNPEATPTSAESALVLRCCTLLAGSPLAIELAAGRLRDYSLIDVVRAVETDLAMLSTTMCDVPARQRSLRAVFEWSWRLLSTAEQAALAGLSVFRGGCTPEAAVAVVGGADLFQRLVERSLIQREADGRYVIHEQVRQFAAEHLPAQPAASALQERHCRFYLGLAAAHTDVLYRATERQALEGLRLEYDNLRAAWEYAHGLADVAPLGAAAPVFGRIYARSDAHEGAALFQRALDRLAPTAVNSVMTRKQLLDLLIGMYKIIGRMDAVAALIGELHSLARSSADPLHEAVALLHRGDLAMFHRDAPAAWEALHAVERISCTDPSVLGRTILAHCLHKRAGLIDWQQLDVDRSYAERAFSLYTALDMPLHAGAALNRLGNQHRRLGDYGAALAARRQAAALIADQGDLDSGPGILNDLGETYMLLGAYAEARTVFEQGLAMAQRIKHTTMAICIREALGRVLFHLGELEAGRACLLEALELEAQTQAHIHRGYYLTTLGYIAERQRHWRAAGDYYTAALAWWAASGHRSDACVEPHCGLARCALAEGNAAAALAHVEAVLPYIGNSALQDALEPMWVHWSCYEVLQAVGDRRATAVLHCAQALLHRQAAQLPLNLRDTFLNNVAAHRALGAAQPVPELSWAA